MAAWIPSTHLTQMNDRDVLIRKETMLCLTLRYGTSLFLSTSDTVLVQVRYGTLGTHTYQNKHRHYIVSRFFAFTLNISMSCIFRAEITDASPCLSKKLFDNTCYCPSGEGNRFSVKGGCAIQSLTFSLKTIISLARLKNSVADPDSAGIEHLRLIKIC